MTNTQQIIERLNMARHPEGGWYVQTFKDPEQENGRARSTSIYYLLEGDDRSHWHRIDAVEVWHFYAGAPLTLSMSPDGKSRSDHVLGTDLASGQRPQIVVPSGHWQSARSLGEWTLCGCTVAPGFEFSGFEMAEKDWQPEQG